MSNRGVLKTRLALLRHSVDEVEHVLEVLKAGRTALTTASNEILEANMRILDLDTRRLQTAREELQKIASKTNDGALRGSLTQVLDHLDRIDAVIPDVDKRTKAARSILAGLSERGVFRDELRQGEEQDLQSRVKDDADAYKRSLGNVDDKLTPGTSPEALSEAWESFNSDVQGVGDDLFRDYLDLLGGIAIRERGVALRKGTSNLDELCAMTDWLIREELLKDVNTAALTVPSQTDALRVSSWPVLRLRFTHWSIWGMPLEAHQFGQLQAARAFKQGIHETKWGATAAKSFGVDGLRTMIADTYACWALGPAYACALVFLRLSPTTPVDERRAGAGARFGDADRAELVRFCLTDQIVPGGKDPKTEAIGYGYFEFVEPIFDEWDEALSLTGTPPPLQKRVEQIAELPRLIRGWLDVKQPFSLHDWRVAKSAWGPLSRGDEINPPIEMRHLLNTAWYGLLTDGHKGGDFGAASAHVEAFALAVGRTIALAQGSLGTSGGTGGSPPTGTGVLTATGGPSPTTPNPYGPAPGTGNG